MGVKRGTYRVAVLLGPGTGRRGVIGSAETGASVALILSPLSGAGVGDAATGSEADVVGTALSRGKVVVMVVAVG